MHALDVVVIYLLERDILDWKHFTVKYNLSPLFANATYPLSCLQAHTGFSKLQSR